MFAEILTHARRIRFNRVALAVAALVVASPAARAEKVVLHTPQGDWVMYITPLGSSYDSGSTHGITIKSAPPATAEATPAEGTPPAPATEGEAAAPAPAPETHGIAITPGPCCDNGGGSPVELAKMYDKVYRSIPYRITESRANRGYRHEATMEILLGQLHQGRNDPQPAPRDATQAPLGPLGAPFSDAQFVNPNSRFGWTSAYGFGWNSRLLGRSVWYPYPTGPFLNY